MRGHYLVRGSEIDRLREARESRARHLRLVRVNALDRLRGFLSAEEIEALDLEHLVDE